MAKTPDEAPRCIRIREGKKPKPTCLECHRLDCPVFQEALDRGIPLLYLERLPPITRSELELEERLRDTIAAE